MLKVSLINIDNNNEVLKVFTTKKTKHSSIQLQVIDEAKALFNASRLWIQGSIKLTQSEKNNCLLGGNLWWICSGLNGRLQYKVEKA